MEQQPFTPPHRVVDIAGCKQAGADVTCGAEFEVVPVDFMQRDNPYRAHVFLCRYSGTVDGAPYSFRKCYARGCSHNLCPHVSQAILIANRYLQRDYRVLAEAGITLSKRLFTLDDMVVKFEAYRAEHGPTLTIDDYIRIAEEGDTVSVAVGLDYLPAVEHFARYQNPQTFLNGRFLVSVRGEDHPTQRCFACYPTEREREDKPMAVRIANKRLLNLYESFEKTGITYDKVFFE